MPCLAVLTNAIGARQPSMLGYGALMMRALARPAWSVREWRAPTLLATPRRSAPAPIRVALDRCLSPLAMAGRHADIVHVADPGNAIALPFVRAGAKAVTVHDMVPYLALEGRLEGFSPSRAGRVLMRTILARLKQADALVTVSHTTKRDLMRLAGIDEARITVIPNAVFQTMTPAPQSAERALRTALDVPADAPLILHIGRNFYKNRAGVIDVFQRLTAQRADVHLLLVGEAEPALRARIDQDPDRIRVVNRLGTGALAAAYSTASALLFPSFYEGFGYPVLEAQLIGTPVVCSDGGSLGEVAGEGAIVHPPHAAEAMAQDLARLIEDPAARAALKERGRQNAKRFTLEDWCRAHHALYDRLVGA